MERARVGLPQPNRYAHGAGQPTTQLGRIKAAAGVEVRFHDLRHTCVTLLLELGVPPHIVREIAGHSALDVTMTIYAHASLEEKYRA